MRRRIHYWDVARIDVIIDAAREVGPSLFFSLLVITVGFLPVFTLQAQAGRLLKLLGDLHDLEGEGVQKVVTQIFKPCNYVTGIEFALRLFTVSETPHKNEKRKLSDRRKCPTPMFSRYTLYGGRRKNIRREEDRKRHHYVDVYSPELFCILLSILLVSCVDAYLTLLMIEEKIVTEANPVMAFYLDFGALPFFAFKYSLTAIPVIILCIMKNSFITRIGLFSAMVIYLLVVLYELHIVYRLHPLF